MEQFEVRDLRHKERFVIDDAYLNGWARKCGIYATGVYLSLCRHSNREQVAWPSIGKIAEELAISERQVRYAIDILKDYNIIRVQRLGKKLNNRYFLLDKSIWSDRHNMPVMVAQYATHPLHNMPLHSKDTHSKDTHKKESTSKEKSGYFSIDTDLTESGGRKTPESVNGFSVFWVAYPRKENKVGAFTRWKEEKPPLTQVLDFIQKAILTDKWKKGYIPLPSNFLKERRWEDDLTAYNDSKKQISNVLVAEKGKYEKYN